MAALHQLPLDPSKPGYYKEAGFATEWTARATIDQLGFAVIPNVLSEHECATTRDKLWDEIQSLCADFDPPFDRTDPDTWSTMSRTLHPHQGMLYQHYVHHFQGLWDVRQNIDVYRAFQRLYKSEHEVDPKELNKHGWQDMQVSFDGMSVLMSHNNGMGTVRKPLLPFHTDQSLLRPDFECIQGFVTLYPVNPGDATLAVMSGSHLLHERFVQKFYPAASKEEKAAIRKDWVQMKDPVQQQWYRDQGCTEVYINCPEGSLVLWDSRTVHCGKLREPSPDNPSEPISSTPRMVAYVCMTPKDRCTPKQLEKRRSAFKNLRGTTHWPEKARLFGKHPRTFGKPLPKVRMPDHPLLLPHGRALAGFNRMSSSVEAAFYALIEEHQSEKL